MPDSTKITDVLVVTMNHHREIFRGHVLIEDGRIRQVVSCENGCGDRDPWPEVEPLQRPAGRRLAVLPGFIDGHAHVTYLPWRYGGEEARRALKAGGPEVKLQAIQQTNLDALAAGVTFLADFAPYDEGVISDRPGVLAFHQVLDSPIPIGRSVRLRPPENPDGSLKEAEAEEHIAAALDMLAGWHWTHPQPCSLFVHLPVERAPEYAGLDSYAAVLRKFTEPIRQGSLWLQVHCCEHRRRARHVERVLKKTSVEALYDLGLLGNRTILAHCIHISPTDEDLIAETGARVMTVPKFTDGCLAPIGHMVDKGIRVGLCSDAYAIDPIARIVEGHRLHRSFEPHTRSRPLEPLELLHMATLGAARALNLDHEMGSIEEGKLANLVLLDLSAAAFAPFWSEFWPKNRAVQYWRHPHGAGAAPSEVGDWAYRLSRAIRSSALSGRDIATVVLAGQPYDAGRLRDWRAQGSPFS